MYPSATELPCPWAQERELKVRRWGQQEIGWCFLKEPREGNLNPFPGPPGMLRALLLSAVVNFASLSLTLLCRSIHSWTTNPTVHTHVSRPCTYSKIRSSTKPQQKTVSHKTRGTRLIAPQIKNFRKVLRQRAVINWENLKGFKKKTLLKSVRERHIM